MSVEQLERSVISLSPEDRRRFADWFYQHEDEILGTEFSEATRREVLRRAEELHVQPGLAQPVDDGAAVQTLESGRRRICVAGRWGFSPGLGSEG